MTLADFKRDIKVGTIIQCNGVENATFNPTDGSYGPLMVEPLAPKMQGARTVTYKDTTGFYLSHTPEDGKRGSFCEYPKASELEYTGSTFTITEKDQRGQVWQKRHYTIVR